jgi:hypothetical protein
VGKQHADDKHKNHNNRDACRGGDDRYPPHQDLSGGGSSSSSSSSQRGTPAPAASTATEFQNTPQWKHALWVHCIGLRVVLSLAQAEPGWLSKQVKVCRSLLTLWYSNRRQALTTAGSNSAIASYGIGASGIGNSGNSGSSSSNSSSTISPDVRAQEEEACLLAKCLVILAREKPTEVDIVFELLRPLVNPGLFVDYTFVRTFYLDDVAGAYSPQDKRRLIRR